jgi:hypothetical protein
MADQTRIKIRLRTGYFYEGTIKTVEGSSSITFIDKFNKPLIIANNAIELIEEAPANE